MKIVSSGNLVSEIEMQMILTENGLHTVIDF